MNNINKELAVKCVKNIADCNRCTICDQLSEPCAKYECGHSVCKKCVTEDSRCHCNSPTVEVSYSIDQPQGLRVKHASELVATFQDLFNVDVNRCSRISEQMQIEKQIFPYCIQAPNKYSNKRKSINLKTTQSPPSVLLGENIKNYSKMNSKYDYIQQWLNSTMNSSTKPVREPLRDLNVNNVSCSYKNSKKLPNNVSPPMVNRKRKHITTFKNENVNTIFKKKNKKTVFSENSSRLNFKSVMTTLDKNDSGISIIDNSLSETDKDKLALTAVLEAELFENKDNTDVVGNINKMFKEARDDSHISVSKSNNYKVSFIKKTPIVEYCRLCCDFDAYVRNNTGKTRNPNNVSIIVENNSFIANINISNCTQSSTKEASMKSVAVQTDITNCTKLTDKDNYVYATEDNAKITTEQNVSNVLSKIDCIEEKNFSIEPSVSNNVAIAENCKENLISDNDGITLPKCVVVEDSDSSNMDIDSVICDTPNVIEVSADVHESCNLEDYVLKTMHQNEYQQRTRHGPRGNTPESTNSSEKENFDPNRIRRNKLLDKKLKK